LICARPNLPFVPPFDVTLRIVVSFRPSNERSSVMKYLLIITMNPQVWDALSEEEHNEVFTAHDRFQTEIVRPGELLSSVALADPSNTKTVRVRDDVPSITDGPYVEAKEFLAGYYLVECDSLERATELAAAIPDARITGIEVRPVEFEATSHVMKTRH
jgi:hypothetical protein